MANLFAGLLGGIKGVADATVAISDDRNKQLADQLKEQARREFELVLTGKNQEFTAGENQKQRNLTVEESKLSRKSQEDNLKTTTDTQKLIAEQGNLSSSEIAKLNRESQERISMNNAALAHQDRQDSLAQRKLEHDEVKSKGIYSNVFHQADADGNMVAYGVRRDSGDVVPLNTGGPKDPGKTPAALTKAIEKINEAIESKDYEGAKAIAAVNGIPMKDVDEVIETHWFTKDETQKRPMIDSAGLLGGGKRVPGKPGGTDPGTQAEVPETQIDSIQQRLEAAKARQAQAKAPEDTPSSPSPPAISADGLKTMGIPASDRMLPLETPAADAVRRGVKNMGGLLGNDADVIDQALKAKGIESRIQRSNIESEFRSKYPNATPQKIADMILSSK